MRPRFYHVNINLKNEKGMFWSPEVDDVLPQGSVEVSVVPTIDNDEMDTIWSPEHLYVASVSSSLMKRFFALAKKEYLPFENFSLKSTGRVELQNGKDKIVEIVVVPVLEVASEMDTETAMRILNKLGESCLVCASIKTKITIRPIVDVAVADFTLY